MPKPDKILKKNNGRVLNARDFGTTSILLRPLPTATASPLPLQGALHCKFRNIREKINNVMEVLKQAKQYPAVCKGAGKHSSGTATPT